jgi:nucleoside-diphosphate-sugar epimerase
MRNNNKESKVIIGVNGYIGSELSKYLKKKNIKTIGLDKSRSASKNFFTLNLQNKKKVDLFFKKKKINAIYHFATHSAIAYKENFDKSFQEDYLSLINLISVLRKNKNNIKLIYLSSSYVYSGFTSKIATENSYLKPVHNFGLAKKFFEDYILKFYPNSVIFRLSSVFGAGKALHPNAVYNLVKECKEKNLITIWGKGKRKMQYVFISDVIKYLSIEKKINPGIYNLAGDEYLNLYTLGLKICKTFKSKIALKNNKQEAETLCYMSNKKLKNAAGNYFTPFERSLNSYLKILN